jgi:hypothetical protein
MPEPHPLTKGFSLRASLLDNGVTTEDAVRSHLAHVHQLITVHPSLRATRYRVNPNNPNIVNPA